MATGLPVNSRSLRSAHRGIGLALAPIAASGLLAMTACGAPPVAEPPAIVAATGERMTVRLAPVADLKPVAGLVTTRDMGEARARIGGTLVRLAVREGDLVRKGQVIGVVADQRLTFETGALEAQAAAAAAGAARAEADLGRVRTLFDKGVYARARLDQAEAEARAARGQLAAARAQQAASVETRSQGAVLAPADGRVLRAGVPAGSVVTAGQSIATITAGERVLRVEIPEAEGGLLRVGTVVAIDPRDLPAAGSGTVIEVYPSVTSGRVTADIRVAGLDGRRVGERVRVRTPVGERPALLVPSRFVTTRFGVDYVRVVDRSGRATEVAVQATPGPAAGQTEILSGLADGDVVLAPRAAS